ncbi:hypothetical protein [Streptomyces sp. NBC_01022]|uniref:hypothetical protein n=1 Tax=Streptomyces sp. NBC_01022 TaxID=2903723 RepID=UPI002DDA5D40|nr:hypothetical protein [Streptomyces sp. NBC_01022]WRZ84831.1 hypothetical protein OG316_33510 [Streptomyces sp. NBC_01022]
MFGRKSSPEAATAKAVRSEHNARFNNSSTDPDSEEFLASHDRVVAAEADAKAARRR